jgi:hypothetical protein
MRMAEVFKRRKFDIHGSYIMMLAVYLAFIVIAFATESPADLWEGLVRIIVSRSVLLTDYIAVGGLGAALINSAAAGASSVFMLMRLGVKPNGATIMAMWLTTGFAFFGKNIFNMIPLTCGVWLFSKYQKEPFANYSLAALLVATLSPTVSGFSHLGYFGWPVGILLSVAMGFFVGFLFPPVSASLVRVHLGYDLYSMGFAGGLICMVLAAIMQNAGIGLGAVEVLSYGNNFALGIGLYTLSAVFLAYGLLRGNAAENIKGFMAIFKQSGRLVSDFYFEFKNSVYINMAVLCAFVTTFVLAVGAELNGPVLAGILTVVGFGSFGKHLWNISPVMLGSILTILLYRWELNAPESVIVILFSTGLAPIAGQFGWFWGIVAGFLHVNIASHTADLSGGMNLYNNGFAAGFVAMFLLPLITALRKEKNT